jgi:hypothetical protein
MHSYNRLYKRSLCVLFEAGRKFASRADIILDNNIGYLVQIGKLYLGVFIVYGFPVLENP